MAKYIDPVVMVPWFDTDGMKQLSMLSFKGEVDHRKLRKIILDFCARNFQKVSKEFADALIEANIKTFTKDPAVVKTKSLTELDKAVEAWIERIQDKDEPTEDKPDTASQGDVS